MDRKQIGFAIAELMPKIIRGAQLEFFRRYSVTQTQFFILVAIHATHDASMGGVARSMKISMPTATGIVGRLVRTGFLRRYSEPYDRRRVRVELTPKGIGFIRKFQKAVSHRWTEVLKNVDDRELGPFYRVILRLQRASEEGA